MAEPKKPKPQKLITVQTRVPKSARTASEEFSGAGLEAAVQSSALVIQRRKNSYDFTVVAVYAPGAWVKVTVVEVGNG